MRGRDKKERRRGRRREKEEEDVERLYIRATIVNEGKRKYYI